jgi:hypothetical protein
MISCRIDRIFFLMNPVNSVSFYYVICAEYVEIFLYELCVVNCFKSDTSFLIFSFILYDPVNPVSFFLFLFLGKTDAHPFAPANPSALLGTRTRVLFSVLPRFLVNFFLLSPFVLFVSRRSRTPSWLSGYPFPGSLMYSFNSFCT